MIADEDGQLETLVSSGAPPREDLREGNPNELFDRTYLTPTLLELASQVVRRLFGEKTETSAVYNLATQFGGAKTHPLTLLYHPKPGGWERRSGAGGPMGDCAIQPAAA